MHCLAISRACYSNARHPIQPFTSCVDRLGIVWAVTLPTTPHAPHRPYSTHDTPDVLKASTSPRSKPRRKIQLTFSGPIFKGEATSLLSTYPGVRDVKIDSRQPDKPIVSAWFHKETELTTALVRMEKVPIVHNGTQVVAKSIEAQTTFGFKASPDTMERLEPILRRMPGMIKFEIKMHYWISKGVEPITSKPKVSAHFEGERNVAEALDVIRTYAAEGTFISKKTGRSFSKMLVQNPE